MYVVRFVTLALFQTKTLQIPVHSGLHVGRTKNEKNFCSFRPEYFNPLSPKG